MSQAPASQPPQIKSRLGAILRATSGNFLEQFDFFLFGFWLMAAASLGIIAALAIYRGGRTIERRDAVTA